jgi:hypothetical protein
MNTRLSRRDGSGIYAIHNPDGSWVEIPAWDSDSSAPSVRAPEVPRQTATAHAKASSPENVRQFLREIGSRGGQARASRHSREELAAWGRVRHQKQPS